MQRPLSIVSLVGVSIGLLLAIGLWSQAARGSVLFNGAGESVLVPTPIGVTPLPTFGTEPYGQPGESTNWLLVTPQPDETIRLGTVREITPTPTPQHTVQAVEGANGAILLVEAPDGGEPVRLGDDEGDAKRWLTTEQYFIWSYAGCWRDCPPTDLERGLYAYVWEDGTNITIATDDQNVQWRPEMGGDWLGYVVSQTFKNPSRVHLHAYHFPTGSDVLLGSLFPYGIIGSEDLYNIHEEKIVWFGTRAGEPHTARRQLYLHDLVTGTTTRINQPDGLLISKQISFSDGVLVGREQFGRTWWGYDIERNAAFTIPLSPPGWTFVPALVREPVQVRDGHLFWGLDVDGTIHRFTAPLIFAEAR